MRPIDADALFKEFERAAWYNNADRDEIAEEILLQMPTLKAEPVRHERWEECDWVEYDGYGECVHYPREGRVCTNCRNAFKKEFVINPRVNRCPNCGAKMEGENK